MKRFIFFIFILGLLVTFGNEGWIRFYRLSQFEKSLAGEIEALRKKNDELRGEIVSLRDAKYLETLIRGEMGYIGNHEILYEFVDQGERLSIPLTR